MSIYNPCDSCPNGPYSSPFCSEKCEFGIAKSTIDMQKGLLKKYSVSEIGRGKPLSIEQLHRLSRIVSDSDINRNDVWVWIEILDKAELRPGMGKVSGYYKVQIDYTHGRSFCCGYPGMGYGFDYDRYGIGWLAYSVKPEGTQDVKISNNKEN